MFGARSRTRRLRARQSVLYDEGQPTHEKAAADVGRLSEQVPVRGSDAEGYTSPTEELEAQDAREAAEHDRSVGEAFRNGLREARGMFTRARRRARTARRDYEGK